MKKYEVEGIGIITEEMLYEEYLRQKEDYEEDYEETFEQNYEDWKFDMLNDSRSAIKEVKESEMNKMYLVYYCDNVKSLVKKFEKLEDAEAFVKQCQEQRRSWQYGDWFIECEEVSK